MRWRSVSKRERERLPIVDLPRTEWAIGKQTRRLGGGFDA